MTDDTAQQCGEMAEWLKAQHWKCCLGQLNEGSNPSLSVLEIYIQKEFQLFRKVDIPTKQGFTPSILFDHASVDCT